MTAGGILGGVLVTEDEWSRVLLEEHRNTSGFTPEAAPTHLLGMPVRIVETAPEMRVLGPRDFLAAKGRLLGDSTAKATSAMRARLIAAAQTVIDAEWVDHDGISQDATPKIVDAILTALCDRDKPMVLAGLDSFRFAMAEQPRPGILADAFTAMIEVVRENRA